ncbi:MATE family efflux transporter [Bacillus sp. CMF21]|uniref:MATE family efflux transporter n=1 Tax=Metabacillus dongyingensis TaxID=2874282 RepID=UPI001CBD4D0B|nr:MATE family efflux transporter [Metabacillus dongyingensis]UAL51433.1 MATE family efflux transporter [Metabacillus dongyingensis]USK27735.1 MATE family efflux transporter [Bacillus sp. CMF21]
MNHKKYIMLAIPLTLSAMTTPLIGAVDTAVVGQLSDPAFIGGVAVGAVVFNTMYWLFGFLRVSTSGFTAQAHGAMDEKLMTLSLVRPLILAISVGILFVLFRNHISDLAMTIIEPADGVKDYALQYIDIRIWGAPFALIQYVILGWLMGLSRIKEAFYLQIGMNGMNIILDILFVQGFSWGVQGVAAATLIAEVCAVIVGFFLIISKKSFSFTSRELTEIFAWREVLTMLYVNRDLFIRTACLLIMFNLFTKFGASFGTEMLAANAILIQIHYLMAYFFDGFANASSILCGRAIGSNDKKDFSNTLSLSFQWSIYTALFVTFIYLLFKEALIRLFTRIEPVADLASEYGNWLLVYPAAAAFGLVLYGVFTGAASAAPVRNSMIYSLFVYLIALWSLLPIYENHGLWLSFLLFGIGRSLFLIMYIPGLKKRIHAL